MMQETYTYTRRDIPGGSLICRSDGAIIPEDLDNVDYQAYLRWVEQGNEPETIESPTPSVIRQWDKLSAQLYSSSLYQEHFRLATRSAPSQIADRLWWVDKDLTTVLVNWVSDESLRLKALVSYLQSLINVLAEAGYPITEQHKSEILSALSINGFTDIAQSFN
jgi:hypothetical protein